MSSMDRCPRVANLQRRTWIAVLAAAILLVTACSGDNAAESPTLPTSAQISTDGVRVGLAGYEVFASPAIGAGATLAIADGGGVAPVVAEAASSWLAPMSPTVRITLDGNRQPDAPLRLSYTLPQGFTPPANAVPVAVACSADGTVDLVEVRMEGDSVVADLPHLSWEVFAWFRPEELTKKLIEYVSPILGWIASTRLRRETGVGVADVRLAGAPGPAVVAAVSDEDHARVGCPKGDGVQRRADLRCDRGQAGGHPVCHRSIVSTPRVLTEPGCEAGGDDRPPAEVVATDGEGHQSRRPRQCVDLDGSGTERCRLSVARDVCGRGADAGNRGEAHPKCSGEVVRVAVARTAAPVRLLCRGKCRRRGA